MSQIRLIRQQLLKQIDTNTMPRCPKCGKTMKAAAGGYKCPEHGKMPMEESKPVMEKSVRERVEEVLNAAPENSSDSR